MPATQEITVLERSNLIPTAELSILLRPIGVGRIIYENPVDGLIRKVLHIVDTPTDVYSESIELLLVWWFQTIELALHHRIFHVVVLPSLDSCEEEFWRCLKVDEVDQDIMVIITGSSNDVSIALSQCAAGYDDAVGAVGAVVELLRGDIPEQDQPAPTISVRQRNVVGHFLDCLFGVVLIQSASVFAASSPGRTYLISFYVRQIERVCEVLCNCAFAAASWASHDKNVLMVRCKAGRLPPWAWQGCRRLGRRQRRTKGGGWRLVVRQHGGWKF